MTLRQSQFVAPVPLVLAQELGLLAEGDLIAYRTSGSAEQLEQLLAGEIDIAVTAIDNLFEWSSAAPDLRLVGQVERTTALAVYARRELGTLSELGDARFGVDAAANGFALVARYLLARAGAQPHMLEVGGVQERLHALLAGRVDATLLGPPFDAVAADSGFRKVADVPALLPDFPGQGLVARGDIVGSDALGAYLGALERAIRASNSMPDEEGHHLLGAHFGASAARSLWAGRPRSLVVPAAGLELLTEIRSSLGLLPDGIRLEHLYVSAR
jgi:ABC-type nitrate/sulfonate/bicarbonate transport system substrate-binding protein